MGRWARACGHRSCAGSHALQEKTRTKNFLMVRKSAAVQEKLRRGLRHQQSALRKHMQSKKTTDHRDKRKRRRL
jgi:hypothetical protein